MATFDWPSRSVVCVTNRFFCFPSRIDFLWIFYVMHRESARIKTKIEIEFIQNKSTGGGCCCYWLGGNNNIRFTNTKTIIFLFLFLFLFSHFIIQTNKQKIRKIFQSTRVPRRSDSIRLVYFSLPPRFFVLYNNSPIPLTEINFCLEKWIGRDCVHVSIFSLPFLFFYFL